MAGESEARSPDYRPLKTWSRGFAQGSAQAQVARHTEETQACNNVLQATNVVQSSGYHQGADKVSLKAQVVFDACWKNLEAKYSHFQTPQEIIWLNGAPGAGKGVNTPFILKSRGLSRAVAMSELLERHEGIRELMNRGELAPDTMVGDALLDVIFNPDLADGAGLLIDGFPRTALQADFLKLLYDKMRALHIQHADGPEEWRFPRPSFKVVVLYVEAEESIRRQLNRAKMASMHNQRVRDAGAGELWAERMTDLDRNKCRARYEIFKAHYTTLLRLKLYFPFSLIDANGTLEDTKAQIAKELRYQSSLDLDEATYAIIKHLPLAGNLAVTSRQQLVSRLDAYCKRHHKVFVEVVRVVDTEIVPLLRRMSLAGHLDYKTKNRVFAAHPQAIDMALDVLSDRGFAVAYDTLHQYVPTRVDLKTGEIENKVDTVHHFRITFERQGVREMALMAQQASDAADTARRISINTSTVPSHLDREQRAMGPHRPVAPVPPVSMLVASSPDLAAAVAPLQGRALQGEFGYEMVNFDQPHRVFGSQMLEDDYGNQPTPPTPSHKAAPQEEQPQQMQSSQAGQAQEAQQAQQQQTATMPQPPQSHAPQMPQQAAPTQHQSSVPFHSGPSCGTMR
ncbi:hypothetical protein WJX72_000150 [[Myrmecia] bisecta]|uniref:adenylate kinase n=1 Tax=[Myrmecia] bisecta TaxID=41462 RepID=A0AAW1QDW5_9CHLO